MKYVKPVVFSSDGAALYRCNPALAKGCSKNYCFMNGGPCYLTFQAEAALVFRFDYLQTMTAAQLADYLARELADGVPCDWAAWLNEEVTVE